MLAELRTYTLTADGREPMLRQFEEVSRPIFADIGIVVHGPWLRSLKKGEVFVYVAEFDSPDDRDAKWAAFREHPDWVQAQAREAASGSPGPIAAMETVELSR
ncbi:NIPSNAP family protein [Microbacterium sp. Root180]|uniref:NIPSNAP family protein n=1 Tax=Microbacterium sp. Root180 TaxID=1736483 RepID=UPI00070174F9|nr:NIPSNAP family protein [Microbacterium sp. Root180]KRB36641.1 hypothetical protein ASD93_11350 [Microbacterium sp. Root180]